MNDCKAVAEVHVAAWNESYADILPSVAFRSMTVPMRARAFERRMDSLSHLPIYVAEKKGRVVGFADGGPERDEDGLGQDMEVYAVYLISSAKRQGIGTSLLKTVVSDFLDQGARSAGLWALRDAAEARCFYESLGAMLASERTKRGPDYERAEVGYIWPDLKRSFS